MHPADWFILITYLAGTVAVGIMLGRMVKSSSDLFSAGGRSPWWASGLSAFMTMFSANTFVVWGSIAFDLGLVAVMINLMYGVAALAAGYFVAGRWKALGVATPAEYVRLRFGVGALHFYTWSMLIFRVVGTAGALYALAKILVALMPLAPGNPLRDDATGNLSLTSAILIFGGIVILYTMIGGLWAVLMTDVLQFLILNLAVLFVVPLALARAGGLTAFMEQAPENFFAATAGNYSWLFLAGWFAIHFFMIGADWAFAQRFLCVQTRKDARKSAYLFGALYLVSPLLWLLPPMIHRVTDPGADPEQAYILSCRAVLPIGMTGLMVAAMFSATASMVSSQLNVFSGVLTHDLYRSFVSPKDDRHMIKVGRFFTLLIGLILISIALQIGNWGGVKDVIIATTELMVVALFAPSIWGLFSKSLRGSAVWIVGLTGFSIGAIARFGLGKNGFLTGVAPLGELAAWIQANATLTNTFTGVIFPILLLAAVQMFQKGLAPGQQRLAHLAASESARELGPVSSPGSLPARIVGWGLVFCGTIHLPLIPINDRDRLALIVFVLVAFSLGGLVLLMARRVSPASTIQSHDSGTAH
jgi:solute:Na+ symporter, SSS family